MDSLHSLLANTNFELLTVTNLNFLNVWQSVSSLFILLHGKLPLTTQLRKKDLKDAELISAEEE